MEMTRRVGGDASSTDSDPVQGLPAATASLYLYEPARVLVCVLCRAGIRPGPGVEAHFRKSHQVKGAELKRILQLAAAAQEETAGQGGLVDPYRAELPDDGSTAIPQLQVRAGFSCTACRFLTTNHKVIRQHWIREVTRHSDSHRGYQPGGDSWADVALQSFSSAKYLTRYWVVQSSALRRSEAVMKEGGPGTKTPAEEAAAEEATVLEPWEEHAAKYAAEEKARQEELAKTVRYQPGPDFESPWVREMGWAAHLDGKNMVDLRQAAELGLPPRALSKLSWAERKARGGQEAKLIRLGRSFDREVARCSLRIGQVPKRVLYWLASRDPARPAAKPFKVKENQETMDKYRNVWKRYLCYCVRALWLGRSEAQSQQGVRFTDEQWTALEAIAEALDVTREASSRVGVRTGEDGDGDGDGDGDNDDEGEQEQYLDESVFMFCTLSLTQEVLVHPYHNPLLHFTAVLAIDPVRSRFREPSEFTSYLACITWCSRLLLLEYFFEHVPIRDKKTKHEDEDEDEGEGEGVQVQPKDVLNFREGYRQWIADSSDGPFGIMLDWMSLGRGYRTKEGGTPRIIWEQNNKALRLHGYLIKIDEFRQMAQALVSNTESMLDQLLYGRSQELLGRADLSRVADTLTYQGQGCSFTTNAQNDWLRPGIYPVAELVSEELWSSQRAQYHHQKVHAWLDKLGQLKKQLLLLTHIWAGLPGRGPEVTTVRYADTSQLSRSVYIYDGQVLLITDRDKSKATRGYGRKVARFLPDRIGRMIVLYITWLVPFETMLLKATGRKPYSEAAQSRLWRDPRKGGWDTDVLTKQLQAATTEHMGVTLGTAAYRHLAIELGRTIHGLITKLVQLGIGADDDRDEDEDEIDEVTGERHRRGQFEWLFDMQATHGSVVARRNYAVNIQFPGQLQPQLIQSYREVSRLWHQYLSWTGKEEDRKREESLRRRRKSSPGRDTTRAQKKIKYDSQHRDMAIRAKSTEDAVLGAAEPSSKNKGPAGVPVAVQEQDVAQLVQQGLERILGAGARWRTAEQEQAMLQIIRLRKNDRQIVVLPTGGGKSLLFMVPAVLGASGGISIVIVPFVALIDDLVARARSFGISCVYWRPSDPERLARDVGVPVADLVVVSADQVRHHEFSNYVEMLRGEGRLRRIFIDECHTIIMDVGYRKTLGGLVEVLRFGYPVIMLTATLPVPLEGWFREKMMSKGAGIIRARIIKENIRYSVRRPPGQQEGRGRAEGQSQCRSESKSKSKSKSKSDAVQDEVIRLVLEKNDSGMLDGDKKGVVYCRSKKDSEALAERIGCQHYHSGMETAVRQEVLGSWAGGSSASRWITATTGLGTGIDIAGICVIIHAGAPYGLVDFVQQTGRGGRREGERAESIIVVEEGGQKSGPWQERKEGIAEAANRAAMEEFIQTTGCRRDVLGRFLDGVDQEDCRSLNVVACDYCEAQVIDEGTSDEGTSGEETSSEETSGEETPGEETSGEETSRTKNQGGRKASSLYEQRKEEQRRRNGLRRWLEEVEGEDRCAVCSLWYQLLGYQTQGSQPHEHRLERCRAIKKAEYIQWRRRVRFDDGACCWRCGLGLEWCEKVGGGEGTGESSGEEIEVLGLSKGWKRRRREECRWNDKVLPVLFSIWKQDLYWDLAREHVVDMPERAEEWGEWVGKERDVLGERATNGLAVVEAVIYEIGMFQR